MRFPKPLFPGARVALLSASGIVRAERLPQAADAVRSLGLEPVIYPSCRYENRHGYLAAGDRQRADDLNAAFADPSIDGILAIKGGYGAHRVLPLLDWEVIRANPKYFSGYSDVTALHTALNQVCDLVTYHTMMPATEYYEDVGEYSMDWLKRALFGGLQGRLENPEGQRLTTLVPGRAQGPCAAATCPCWPPPWAPPGRSTPGESSCSWRTLTSTPTGWTGCSLSCGTPASSTSAPG